MALPKRWFMWTQMNKSKEQTTHEAKWVTRSK